MRTIPPEFFLVVDPEQLLFRKLNTKLIALASSADAIFQNVMMPQFEPLSVLSITVHEAGGLTQTSDPLS